MLLEELLAIIVMLRNMFVKLHFQLHIICEVQYNVRCYT